MAQNTAQNMTQSPHPELLEFGAFLAERLTGDLAGIFEAFAGASVTLRDSIESAPLLGLLGKTGATNVQQEATAKLDDIANGIFCDALRLPQVARLISEEEPEPIEVGAGAYTCCFDPLDGSSNIGVSSVGSILGVYTDVASGALGESAITGRQMAAAAFVVYGLPTVLIFATADRADGFTYDPSDRTWRLTFPAIRIPEAAYTSINWAYRSRWPARVASAVDSASEGLRGRYSGSMVEDVLRVLLAGGVFLYPEDSALPAGKLRMLYEICPVGMVMEAAGGAASNGTGPVLDVPVTAPHQRGPFIAGASDAVERYVHAYALGDGR